MRVTQEADYAIRMCLILDKLGEKTGAATLAELACITPKIALKVLRKLNTAGVVKSYKGVQGGYELARGGDELKVLERFMDNDHSVMFFFDYETKRLPRLEAFLGEWGVRIARHTDAVTNIESNYLIRDEQRSTTADGYTNQAVYVEAGLGASLTRQLREAKNPKQVMFPFAGAIESTYDLTYNDEKGYYYGSYSVDGVLRDSFNVFTSSDSAVAVAGEQPLDAKAPFNYMTVTRETMYHQETNESTYAYLLACSSTDFVSMGALDGSYGNHTVLTRACQELGGAQVSVSLGCKYFADLEINTITAKAANQYTVVLAVVPASVIFIAGVYIMIRRKYA